MSVQVFSGYDGAAPREFFFAKQRSKGSSQFDVLASGTALVWYGGDCDLPLRASLGLEEPALTVDMAFDPQRDEWRALVDLPPGRPLHVAFTAADGVPIPPNPAMQIDEDIDEGLNVVQGGKPLPAYVARVVGRLHQGSEGVGGRSACTAIAALAALRALTGATSYWEPTAVDRLLREGTELYERYRAARGAALPAGVEHAEFDDVARSAPELRPLRLAARGDGMLDIEGRAFVEAARQLWEAGRRAPEALAITCLAQTVVAVALPGPPQPDLLRCIQDHYARHRHGWRPPPLEGPTLLLFDSHRHTPERGGARDAAWLLFPSPEALAAYLGVERFPCYAPDDPQTSSLQRSELLFTRQFATFRVRAEGVAQPRSAPGSPQAAEARAEAERLRRELEGLVAEEARLRKEIELAQAIAARAEVVEGSSPYLRPQQGVDSLHARIAANVRDVRRELWRSPEPARLEGGGSPANRSPADRSPTDRSPADRSPTDRSPSAKRTSASAAAAGLSPSAKKADANGARPAAQSGPSTSPQKPEPDRARPPAAAMEEDEDEEEEEEGGGDVRALCAQCGARLAVLDVGDPPHPNALLDERSMSWRLVLPNVERLRDHRGRTERHRLLCRRCEATFAHVFIKQEPMEVRFIPDSVVFPSQS